MNVVHSVYVTFNVVWSVLSYLPKLIEPILCSSRQDSTFITHNFPLTMTRASIVTNFSGLFTLKVILFPVYCPGPHVIKYLAQAYSTFIIIPSFNAFWTKCKHSFTMYPMPLIILHTYYCYGIKLVKGAGTSFLARLGNTVFVCPNVFKSYSGTSCSLP